MTVPCVGKPTGWLGLTNCHFTLPGPVWLKSTDSSERIRPQLIEKFRRSRKVLRERARDPKFPAALRAKFLGIEGGPIDLPGTVEPEIEPTGAIELVGSHSECILQSEDLIPRLVRGRKRKRFSSGAPARRQFLQKAGLPVRRLEIALNPDS